MGYRIREYRENLNMTQEELAAKSNISRATISAMENGTDKNVSTKTLIALAAALNTTVANLFFADGV